MDGTRLLTEFPKYCEIDKIDFYVTRVFGIGSRGRASHLLECEFQPRREILWPQSSSVGMISEMAVV